MAHIFISYAHTDHEYARKLADYLLANGFDVWIDDRIDFGTRWVRSIFEALDSCAAFIVVMTPRAQESEFVEKEYLRAADQKKPSFPLLLEGSAFPYFVGIQYHDVRGGKLPESDFLERLAEFAPRTSATGREVASAAQQQAKIQFETSETNKIEPEIVTTRLTKNARSTGRSRGWVVLGAVGVLIVAVAAVLVVSINPLSLSGAPATATATPFGGGHGQIVFLTDRDGNHEIYVMNADGSNPHNLTDNPGDDEAPAWSPDGSQIAFASDRGNPESSFIYLMDANGGNVRKLFANLAAWDPSWSPDRKQIAFTAYGDYTAEIYVAGVNGSNPHPLNNNSSNEDYSAWSPDGTQIAFVSDRDGNNEIYVMDADGSNARRLTDNPADDLHPAWSPDGKQIVFQSNRESTDEIYVMDVQSTAVQALTSAPVDGYEPDWSPDGKQIAFRSYRDSEKGDIYLMDTDGGNVRRLTDGSASVQLPIWRP